MALANYNGWAGFVREKREYVLQPALKSGVVPQSKICAGCNYESGIMPITYHSEEYGSTPQHYLDNVVPLCARCHALIHLRHSHPQVWYSYLWQIKEQGPFGAREFPSLYAVFNYIFSKKKKIPLPADLEYPVLGTWLDTLSPKTYDGPPKIATIIAKTGVHIPDPKVYSMSMQKDDVLEGIVVGKAGNMPATFKYLGQEAWLITAPGANVPTSSNLP